MTSEKIDVKMVLKNMYKQPSKIIRAIITILGANNTLVYLCGMKGMQTGIYEQLAKQGFLDYLSLVVFRG